MRKIIILIALILPCYILNAQYTGKIVKIIDGDSFVVQMTDDGREENVTFYGIDAPELEQEYGVAAKKYLGRYLHREVNLEYKNRNKEDEMMAIITFKDENDEDVNLNYELVENGYAWKNKYIDDKLLEKSEKKAQKDKKGLWKADNPVAPWEWVEH